MNKLKIIMIIVTSLVLCFIIAEAYYAAAFFNKLNLINQNHPDVNIKFEYHKSYPSKFIKQFWEKINIRYYDKQSNKTIMVLGCSYAGGANLEKNQNFEALLSNSLNYNVINAGFFGHGLQSAYKFLSDRENEKQIKSKYNVDLFIYIYMKDHLRRLYDKNSFYTGEIYPQYKIKKEKLVEIKPYFPSIYSLYSVNNFNNKISYENIIKEEKTYKMFNALIYELQKTTKELYPNSKFMILVVPVKYSYKESGQDSMFPDDELKKIEAMGIEVVNAENLTSENLRDEKWYIEDKCHPSSNYWKLIVPKLAHIIKQEIK